MPGFVGSPITFTESAVIGVSACSRLELASTIGAFFGGGGVGACSRPTADGPRSSSAPAAAHAVRIARIPVVLVIAVIQLIECTPLASHHSAAPPPRTFPLVLAGFSAFLDLYATQPLLPMLARTYHASNFAVSLTVTAPTMAVAVAAPVAGRLADRFGMRRLIVVSAFALTAATMLAATATGLRTLI